MMITDSSKRVIPFRERDAKRIGEGCFYLDSIVWLNGDRIELGDNVGFNVGCFVNGFSGLVVGDGTNFGPYSMVHTANHNMEDTEKPVTEQGWRDEPPVRIGDDNWAIYSQDGSLAAHFEFTIAVTGEGPRILTPWHLSKDRVAA